MTEFVQYINIEYRRTKFRGPNKKGPYFEENGAEEPDEERPGAEWPGVEVPDPEIPSTEDGIQKVPTSCSISYRKLKAHNILFILVRYTVSLLLQFYRIKYLGESSYSSNTGQAHISLSKIFILP